MFLSIICLNPLLWLQYIVIVSQLFNSRILFHIFKQHYFTSLCFHALYSHTVQINFYAWKYTVFII